MDPPSDPPLPTSPSTLDSSDTTDAVVHSERHLVSSDASPGSGFQRVDDTEATSLGSADSKEVEAPNPDDSTTNPLHELRTELPISPSNAVIVTESPSPVPPTPPAKANILPEQTHIPDNAHNESLHSAPMEDSYVNGHPIHVNTPGPSTSTPTSQKSSSITTQGAHVSIVLISSALEIILASKEAKRSAPFRESAQHALELIRSSQGGEKPRDIFEPLRLACETRNEKLMIASLDCISKLISYSFFAENTQSTHSITSPPTSPGSDGSPPSLVDLVVHTITACHTETTPETVSLQIVKALLSLVLSPTIFVHHSSLLKAVRTVYNVFLLSADPVNQMVAQGGLTQMVHHVFTRCYVNMDATDPADMSSSAQESEGSRRPSLANSQAGVSPTSVHSDKQAEELPISEFSETLLEVESPAVNILGDDAVIFEHAEPLSVPLWVLDILW
jgi:brefeldin A-inhibited guanine nucleotide-exchange protein